MKKRFLIIEDGTIFEGTAFGSEEASIGEMAFSTGMTGYQETISNPSACGNILVMTYPSVGGYGVNRDDYESIDLSIHGLAVRELEEEPSNFRSSMTLHELLTLKGIPGIQGIDTRKLTRLLREKGALKGILTAAGEDIDTEKAIQEVNAYETPVDLVARVSTQRAYPSPGRGKRVVLIDYGMKHGILRELNKKDCDIIVVPYHTSSEEILALKPDGIVLSNGPGNPKDNEDAIRVVKELLGKAPIFGIGLGHQLFALACGADTKKMKVGHNGGNHPVKELASGRTELTSQCHSYTVVEESLEGTGLEITHIALNDQSVEGLKSEQYNSFTVQFHPEASPGPEDSIHLFERFTTLLESCNGKELTNA